MCVHECVECAHLHTHVHLQRAEKGIKYPPLLPTFSFEEPKAHVFLSRPVASLRDSPVPVPLRVGFQACLGRPASDSESHNCVIRPLHH